MHYEYVFLGKIEIFQKVIFCELKKPIHVETGTIKEF